MFGLCVSPPYMLLTGSTSIQETGAHFKITHFNQVIYDFVNFSSVHKNFFLLCSCASEWYVLRGHWSIGSPLNFVKLLLESGDFIGQILTSIYYGPYYYNICFYNGSYSTSTHCPFC